MMPCCGLGFVAVFVVSGFLVSGWDGFWGARGGMSLRGSDGFYSIVFYFSSVKQDSTLGFLVVS